MLSGIETPTSKAETPDVEMIDVGTSTKEIPLSEVICKICLDPFIVSGVEPVKKYIRLSCEHLFHVECLAQYFTVEVTCKNIPLRCPDCT